MRKAKWFVLPIVAGIGIAVLTAQAPKTFKGRYRAGADRPVDAVDDRRLGIGDRDASGRS